MLQDFFGDESLIPSLRLLVRESQLKIKGIVTQTFLEVFESFKKIKSDSIGPVLKACEQYKFEIWIEPILWFDCAN